MADGARTDGRTEAVSGPAFAFGKSWRNVLGRLDDEKIRAAVGGGSGNDEYVFRAPLEDAAEPA